MSKNLSLGGKILHIDLTNRKMRTESTQAYSDRFLGGMGISAWRLLRDFAPGVAALDPQAILAFNAGVLVGTAAPAACRLGVVSRNVLTGGFGSASAGGNFAPEMKYAGYDQIFVTGKAAKPVYVFIEDDSVAIEDASSLWGETTWETEDRLRDKLARPTLEFATIGPAGENLVPAANIVVDRARSASRCGVGAVMGSKNLKAVAVSGSGHIEVADPEGFMEASFEMMHLLTEAQTTKYLRKGGTPTNFERTNEASSVPSKNFQQTQMDREKVENMKGEVLKRDHIIKNFGCYACPIHCSQFLKVKEGPYAGADGEKIEQQNLWVFGAKLDVDNLPAIIKASHLCWQLGLDIDNVSGPISWAYECYQRGLLTEEDTDGLKLEWGNHAALVELIGKIAHREGIGALLAKGSREAARILGRGSEKYAIHIKGQELSEELRIFKAWGLGIVVAERGAGHTTGAPTTEKMSMSESLSQELFGIPTASTPNTYEGKAKLVAYFQRFHAALECLGACFFSSRWFAPYLLGPNHFATLYSLATGGDFSEHDLMAMGQRVHTLQKMFNVRHGNFGRADDHPPDRLLEEPATGTQESEHLGREAWGRLLDEYYDIHGWDPQTTRPRKETLHQLGLDELVDLV